MPVAVSRVLISTQHSEEVEHPEIKAWVVEHVIKAVIPADLLTDDTVYQVNPTGRFVTGGPHGDCGLTGRKIIVDTYGGFGGHGGGAFSGKDPSKVDRSAAYKARWLAKTLVVGKFARRVDVELSYAIGVAEPSSVFINTHGTGIVDDGILEQAIRELVDLRPAAIIERLQLKSPGYQTTASLGHFGRSGPRFPRFTWEVVDNSLVDSLWSVVGDELRPAEEPA